VKIRFGCGLDSRIYGICLASVDESVTCTARYPGNNSQSEFVSEVPATVSMKRTIVWLASLCSSVKYTDVSE
jgi:hypothetical protein